MNFGEIEMNERIQQLAKQAGMVKILEEHAHEYGAGMFENTPYPELEKFAELIVRECIERVRNQYTPIRDHTIEGKLNPFHSEIRLRTERETGIVECGVNSVISLEELIQEQTDKWYKENISE